MPQPQSLRYAPGLRIYKLAKVNERAVTELSSFVGTQKLTDFPLLGVAPQSLPQCEATEEHLPPPEDGVTYPIVGLLDSGTDRYNPHLQKWVVGRDESDVPKDDQDNEHGSMVGGLLCNTRALNHSDPRFPSARAKIFDAVVFPKGGQEEWLLVQSIRRVVATNRHIKVWNLSINFVRQSCVDGELSTLPECSLGGSRAA